MTHSNSSQERWLTVRNHFALDALFLLAGMVLGAVIRFQDVTPERLSHYLPAVLAGAVCFPSLIYGMGLYSDRVQLPRRYRFLMLFLCYLGALAVMLGIGSLSFESRVGRGVLLMSVVPTCVMVGLHHGLIIRRSLAFRERMLVIVARSEDIRLWSVLEGLKPAFVELVGTVDARSGTGLVDSPPDVVAHGVAGLNALVDNLRVDCLLCTPEQFRDPVLGDALRRVAFCGARLVSLTDVIEDAFRLVPLGFVTPEWLLMASTMPQRSYVRKWKRLFDVAMSLAIGALLLPVLLLGMLWVKLASPNGPVFFKQVRCGRLGRKFRLLKLRTMKLDAEAGGPQWASHKDPRVILGGSLLRKFRIDEIPQLLNILHGDMSFVGPRPERPEFEEQLAAQIPYFRDRLLVAPGLTGWAQVRHPYGASVDDSRRKLEYDLYYMKHMTMTLDLFILLDTARIVLGGGVVPNERTERCMRELAAGPRFEPKRADLALPTTELG